MSSLHKYKQQCNLSYMAKSLPNLSLVSLLLFLSALLYSFFNNPTFFQAAIYIALPSLLIVTLGWFLFSRFNMRYANEFMYLLVTNLLLSWLYLCYLTLQVPTLAAEKVEYVIDLLLMLFAIGIFPHRQLSWISLIGFIGFLIYVRIEYPPEDVILHIVRLTCLAAVYISCQSIMLKWFNRSNEQSFHVKQLLANSEQEAHTDNLTSLHNRRAFDKHFYMEEKSAQRNDQPLALIMIDVDYFKKLNDSLGHAEGDNCLVEIGKILQQVTTRPRDFAARFGGEEFVILLPETPLEGAIQIANKIQQILAQKAMHHPASDISKVITVSQGIAMLSPNDSQQALLERADQLLYQAKQNGRNQICF